MDQDVAEQGIKGLARHSAVSFGDALRYPGYKYVPVSFLVCEHDQAVPVEAQREEIAMMERESGNPVDVTTITTGHCPHISAPSQVVSWVAGLIGRK